MTLQPRLLADFAATPTRTERAAVRAHWRNASPSLFDAEPANPEPACPVCAGPHAEPDCPHGTAPTFELDEPEHQADDDGPRVELLDRWGRCAGTGRPPAAAGRCSVCADAVPVRTDGNVRAHHHHR